MKYFFSILMISQIVVFCSAQLRYDYNWVFNKFRGYDPNNNPIDSGANLHFHPDLTIDYYKGGKETYVMNTSFSDKNGNLLFYTNGCVIMDKNHQIIPGGDSINYGSNGWGDCYAGVGYARGPQGAIFLPKPEYEDSIINLFHLFGEALQDPKIGVRYYTFEIRKTEISKIKNQWKVTEKNKSILRDTLSFNSMVATKHQNNKDWWIILPDDAGPNTKYTYNIIKITKDGASEIKKQKIGDLLTGTEQCNFSPDGTKYALYNFVETYVSLFDFDRGTGTLSNYRKFNLPDTNRLGGCSFSPNSRFLYVTETDKIWQYDTYAADIDASRELVATYDGFLDPTVDTSKTKRRTYFWQMQQGPDCKLYINAPQYNKYLSYINKPNEKGVACDVRQHAIFIRTGINKSLPYFPNYRLGTIYENDCDTITGVGWLNPYLENDALEIVPNPSQGSFEVRNLTEVDEPTHLQIYNMTGQILYNKIIQPFSTSTIIDDHKLNSGIYIIHQKNRNNNIKCAKLVIIK